MVKLTLRQFVEQGQIGTYTQRQAFETGQLEAVEFMERTGHVSPVPSMSMDELIWEAAFDFWARMVGIRCD